ncbi:oligoribonuclease, mitochondrial-like isoform X2 [Hemitrygon akajei]|uniref:oligoribonuclease, mitochondrial-like isoform X2 n=1 Tax=Hemitrygon akajei TaxID=2704970 RepID=UPI003BF95A46
MLMAKAMLEEFCRPGSVYGKGTWSMFWAETLQQDQKFHGFFFPHACVFQENEKPSQVILCYRRNFILSKMLSKMTGLDIEKDKIIEMACIITDAELNILAEGPHLIVNQPNELLDGMSEWCVQHHGKSGLTQAVRDSKISLQQAEYEFLSFVRQHTPPGLCPLAGNSVHADKKFLDKYMPQFMRHLHYRIIDVSTIKELCRRWYPDKYEDAPKKKASHRALDDIHESIKELQFYRKHVFKEGKAEEKKRKMHQENSDSSKQDSQIQGSD